MTKQVYGTLYEVNRELIAEYRKRENNHTALLAALKEMNQMIQLSANLRGAQSKNVFRFNILVGQVKTRIVASCREAVKSNNMQALFKIVKIGKV